MNRFQWLLCFGVMFASTASACMMPYARWLGDGGDVDQELQQVLNIWHDGQQELIIRVSPFFHFPGGDAVVSKEGLVVDPAPPSVVWVITLPEKPEHYHLADRKVFSEAQDKGDDILNAILERRGHGRSFLNSNSAPSNSPQMRTPSFNHLDISAPINVGPYEIVEVKARGMDGLGELNQFLSSNGFPTEDYDHLKWWIERNFTFLVIKITPPEGEKHLSQKLDLEPLQVGFKTPRIYYPGMFSARQGNFRLNMVTISSEPLKEEVFNTIGKGKLRGDEAWEMNIWTERGLPKLLKDAAHRNESSKSVQRWYFNGLVSYGFNPLDAKGKPTISSWTEDVFFDLGGQFHADRGEDEATLGPTLGSIESSESYPWLVIVGIVAMVFSFVLLFFMKRKSAAQ